MHRKLLGVIFMLALICSCALGEGPTFIRSIDVMKYSKDVMTHQPSDAQIRNLIAVLKTLNVDYIALAIPMDPSSDYRAGSKPAPRDAYGFTRAFADAAHGANLRILWRGTWSGIEGLYGFERRVGERRFPAGTATSAPTDGDATWLGKTYQYIISNPEFFSAGDLWAPLPERTEGIFQDATAFLPHDGGLQANYARFFADLKTISDAAFATIGKEVITGMTANNYTEVKSGWLPREFFQAQGIVAIDYYGHERTPAEFDRDIRQMHTMHGRPVFIQEWADYWNGALPPEQRADYLRQVYATVAKLADEGIVVGLNYWGGWAGSVESIIDEREGRFELNARGKLLQEFLAGR